YNPPPEFVARVKRLSAPDRRGAAEQIAYDGEVAYADSQLARVFAWLRARGLADRTLMVIAGDHGEGLGDHSEQTHGVLLYDSTLRVPLVIVSPSREAAVQDEPVSLSEI